METNANGRKLEFWVVDKPALLEILGDVNVPFLGEQLRDKVIVVPISVYNEIIRDSSIHAKDSMEFTMFNAWVVSTLMNILAQAACRKREDGDAGYLESNYLPKNGRCQQSIRFVFIMDVSAIRMYGAVKYCIKNLEMMTRQICAEEQIDYESLEKWPEVRAVYDIKRRKSGRYLCDFD